MLENLPIELVEMIIDTLPFEMSFIDAEDRVQYYSKGDDRIFKRSPAVIGKKVQNCHPPKSLDKVNAILNGFREKTRDSAEFWIPLGDFGCSIALTALGFLFIRKKINK